MVPEALRVAVIVGSTREGRVGGRIGRWFVARARGRGDVAVEVIDLAGFSFPGALPKEPTAEIVRFTDAVARAEAFVVVTPEYNRSYPASVKQAIDYAYEEWHAKPVGFVSYGSRSNGVYAVEALRCVFAELHAVTMRDGVGMDLLAAGGGGGGGSATDEMERDANTLLEQLTWWGLALREARARRPYVA